MLNNPPPPLLEHHHHKEESDAGTTSQHPLFAASPPSSLAQPLPNHTPSLPDMVSIFANHLKQQQQQQQQQQQHQPLSLVKMPSPSASSNSSNASSNASSQSRSGPLRSTFSIRSILEEKEDTGNNNNKGGLLDECFGLSKNRKQNTVHVCEMTSIQSDKYVHQRGVGYLQNYVRLGLQLHP